MPPRSAFSVRFLLVCALLSDLARAAPAPVDREVGLPFIDAFTPRDYRGHQQVPRIAEDAAGLLYFGNLNKVLVYDGAHWSHLAVPDATFIRALAVDATDTLWIGAVDELGYAPTDATGARTFVSLKALLPAAARPCGIVSNLVPTPHGILFQSTNWLLRWDGTRFVALRLPESPRWSLVTVGAETWVSAANHGWFRVRDSGDVLHLDALPAPPECAADRATAAAPSTVAGESLIVTENHGLWRWDGRAFTAFPTSADAELRQRQPAGLCTLADGRLVVTSPVGGVWIFDTAGHLHTRLTEETGLPDNTAFAPFASRDPGALWIGLGRGVVRIDARPWLSWFNTANGMPRSKLDTPIRFRGQLLAPGAAGGLLRLIPATADAPAQIVRDPIFPGHVYDVTAAHDALVLTGTAGLGELGDDGKLTPLPSAPPNATAFFALAHRPGIWAVLNNDQVRLYRREATGWTFLGIVPGLERVRGMLEDSDGSWWLGRPAGGVLHAGFRDGPDAPPFVETFAAPDGLPVGHGWTRFTSDAQGALLTCNLGLLRFDAATRRFRPTAEYGASLADGSTHVNASIPDQRDGLWMIVRPAHEAEAGNELRLAYGQAGQLTALRLPHLPKIDDPTHFFHEPAAAGRPETLWITGHSAIVRLDLDRWRSSPAEPPPRLRLRSVVTGTGHPLPLVGSWQLPFSDRSLRVQFAAPSLAAHPGATYESTLESASGAEVRTDTTPERDFSSLGAGRYTLSVRARHPGGTWSAPAGLAFTVRPPWWFSPLAFSGYAAAALLALAAVWRLRTLRWLRRQRELESAVASRTAELAAQNAELVRLRQIEFDEKLAARLAEHKARLEVLRYQLNPHFLFNTLNSICAQIIQAPRNARDTVIRLAEFCRLTLHRPGESDEPTLGEEIEMLRAYLDIEQTRLGDLLDYSIATEPSLAALRLPPFLLLPLVENAVKYGAATSKDRVRIRLAFRRGPDGAVLIEVANSGVWIPPDTVERTVPSLGIGLENLRQRLARYFPGKHEFTTEPTDGWVVVRLRLLAS